MSSNLQVNRSSVSNSPFNSDILPKINHFDLNKKMFDMNPFRKAAAYFEENGHYPHYSPLDKTKLDTREGSKFTKYWLEEHRRCTEGLWIGEKYVTPFFYAHLNYGRLKKVDAYTDEQTEALKLGKTIRVKRNSGFPDPWDGTWHTMNFFQDCVELGKHMSYIKSRGVGATYQLSTIATNTYYHEPGGGTVFIVAPNEESLTGPDSILTRVWEHMDFIEQFTPYFKPREGGKSNTSMTRRSKEITTKDGVSQSKSKGKVSSITGIIVKDPNKFRGQRGNILILDEAGANAKVNKIINISRRSFEQNGAVYGTIIACGTGGSAIKDLAAFQEIIQNPDAFNMLSIPNVFSTVSMGEPMGLFIGAYWNNAGFFDKYGRSDVNAAYASEKSKRDKRIAVEGEQSENVLQYISENAMHPEEAMQNVKSNGMPLTLLKKHVDFIKRGKIPVEVGRMDTRQIDKGIFIPDKTVTPCNLFPITGNMQYEGAVVVRQRPIEGHKYCIGIDPYAQDKSTTSSHGCIIVFNLTTDMIVAEFMGRPETNDEFMKIAVAMGRMYNAVGNVLVENDVPEFKTQFKILKAMDLLAPRPRIIKDIVPNSKSLRPWGMNMNPKMYATSLILMIDWMKSAVNKEGLIYLHTIFSLGLILELIMSSEDGNFDRLKAFSMVFIQRQEYLTNLKKDDSTSKQSEALVDELKEYMLNFYRQ